jgi:hypothetical protein
MVIVYLIHPGGRGPRWYRTLSAGGGIWRLVIEMIAFLFFFKVRQAS